jgi:hypothetical protein
MRVTVIMRFQVNTRAGLAIRSRGIVHLPDRLVRRSPFPQLEGVSYVARLTCVPIILQLRRCSIVMARLHAVHAEPLGVGKLGRGCRFWAPLVPAY